MVFAVYNDPAIIIVLSQMMHLSNWLLMGIMMSDLMGYAFQGASFKSFGN